MSFTQHASAAVSLVTEAVMTKSLSQMIKGIRGSKDKNQHEFIAQCLAEIKKELISTDYDYKTEALKKLIFLQMMGYDLSWAAFHIIEVMSAQWFGHRRIGFLAAGLAFNQTTDLILLTTNLLQKAFQQQSIGVLSLQNHKLADGIQYEIGSAISCFSSIVTPELANDLLPDVINLLQNQRPYIRKRAILALYSIFHKHPPALRLGFDALLDKLSDENPSVNSSVVYVLCELISKTPKNYLDLAPQFFHILTSSSNNWVLIKIVKIMGFLVPFEPRLAKKLQDPLSSIITTTPAKSLMYECINTLLCGQIGSRTVVRLCLDKLRELVESSDQNLKYLGLLGLNKLIHSFPRIVVQHKDLILDCLNDHDITIRTRALDLVYHLVTPNNLPGVVKKLLQHINAVSQQNQSSLSSPTTSANANQGSVIKDDKKWHSNQYHNTVLTKILELCSQDQYSMIADFEWFFYTLIDFTRIKGVSIENVLFIQFIMKDLLISIPDLRPFAINQLCTFILGYSPTHSVQSNQNMSAAADAAAADAAAAGATTTGGKIEGQNGSQNGGQNQGQNGTGLPQISTCHLLQDIYQYTLLHELQLTETVGHYNTMENTQSKLKKQALQQLHNKKQHQYKQISSTYMQFNPMVDILSTLSWCIGEYVSFAHSHHNLINCFLMHPCLPFLSSTTQSSFLFTALKIFYNSFQQPWFNTIKEANEYELEQFEEYKKALIQSKKMRQNSILPKDFNIDDAANYEQKISNSDNEDEDDEDDDEDNDIGIKGGQIAISALGHNLIVGRTFPQHVLFLEKISSTIISGLNMLSYHTPYPEVQDRSFIFFHYILWFFEKLGPEFNSGGILAPSPATITETTKDNQNNGQTSPKITGNDGKSMDLLENFGQNNNKNNKKISKQTKSEQLTDLTSLIFKEQQQNTALDALIGVQDNADSGNNQNNSQIEFNFDPLASPSSQTFPSSSNQTKDLTLSTTTTDDSNNNDLLTNLQQQNLSLSQNSSNLVEENRIFSENFIETIETCIKYLAPLFSEELVPISNKTQKRVPVPQGLDLEECIYDLELDTDKPLFDAKTHPLFPIGAHLMTSTYISSKDLDKRDGSMGSSNEGFGYSPQRDGKKGKKDSINGGYSNNTENSMSSSAMNNTYNGDNNDNNNNDDDDDDLFATKDEIGKKKGVKKGAANMEIQNRHKDDPFYIGSSSKTTTKNTKKGTKSDNATLTLDDLEGEITPNTGTKKMSIKKTQTKAVIDIDDDENGFGGKKISNLKTTTAVVDPLDDLLGTDTSAAPVKGKKKKGTKAAAAAAGGDEEAEVKPKKKVTKKKTKGGNGGDDENSQQQQPQQQQPQQQQQQGPIAPFTPPSGTLSIYSTEEVNIYARARPYLQDIDLQNESVNSPIILVAVTIVANPDIDNDIIIPMFQLSIHGNKGTQVQPSPVPQPSLSSQSIMAAGNNTSNTGSNTIHLQAKNITKINSQTIYFSINWPTPQVSTSSRYFNFDLKFMINGKLIQWVNPITNCNQLQLPTSIFLQPQKVPMSYVQDLLTSPDNTCTSTETYIAMCKNQQQVMSVLKGTEIALNLSLVEAANKTAVYYGQCITLPPEMNHIFAYIKYTGGNDNRVHITIKTSSPVLSTKLIQDLVQLLHLDDDDDDNNEEEGVLAQDEVEGNNDE